MSIQALIVFGLVTGSLAYALWTLMPQAVRRALAGALLRLPLPQRLRPALQAAAEAKSGCCCSGCDLAQPKAPRPLAQALVFHPRKHP